MGTYIIATLLFLALAYALYKIFSKRGKCCGNRRAAGIRLEYNFAMVHAIRFLIRLEARAVAGAHHVAGRSFLQAAQSSITVGHFII